MQEKKLILLILTAILAACAEQKEQQMGVSQTQIVVPCVFQNLQTAPGWVCGEPVPGLDIQAVGMAEKSAAGQNYMKDMARMTALSQFSEKIKAIVSHKLRDCAEKNVMGRVAMANPNSGNIATLVNKSFEETLNHTSLIGPEGRIYVLAGLDKVASNVLVEEAIIASIKSSQRICPAYKEHR